MDWTLGDLQLRCESQVVFGEPVPSSRALGKSWPSRPSRGRALPRLDKGLQRSYRPKNWAGPSTPGNTWELVHGVEAPAAQLTASLLAHSLPRRGFEPPSPAASEYFNFKFYGQGRPQLNLLGVIETRKRDRTGVGRGLSTSSCRPAHFSLWAHFHFHAEPSRCPARQI